MRREPLGDEAFALLDLPDLGWRYAAQIRPEDWPGLEEVNAVGFSLGVYTQPEVFDEAAFLAWLERVEPGDAPAGRLHEIPVCLELGLDFEELRDRLGAEALHLLFQSQLECHAIGFQPGFPYLSAVHGPLGELGRRPEPRLAVPAGSVAVAAGQTGIYPGESPGGWWLVGRTPLSILGPDRFPIQAGDRVLFRAISRDEFKRREGEELR